MIGYPYIQTLFQTILNNSMVVQGNFFVCPKWGSELSNPNITEALPIGAKSAVGKYPAVMLMPPRVMGNYQYFGDNSGISAYHNYRIKLLFLGGTFNTGTNQPMQPNALYKTTHTIVDTQHDMMRVCVDFMAEAQLSLLANGAGIINDRAQQPIDFVFNIGPDQAAGVFIDFILSINPGCIIEDYPSGIISPPSITDTHPIHKM